MNLLHTLFHLYNYYGKSISFIYVNLHNVDKFINNLRYFQTN